MMLTPIFKSADPDFNYRAAEDAAALVLSMDVDEARAFTTSVVAETLWDDIAKNQRTLQRHLDEVVAKRLDAIGTGYEQVVEESSEMISKRLTPVGMAEFGQALGQISKATRNPYDYGYTFDESDFRRDPRSGQFQSKVKYRTKKPVDDKTAAAHGIPTSQHKAIRGKRLTEAQKAYYQQGYKQVADFLDLMAQSGASADFNRAVTIRDHTTGRTYVQTVNGNQPPEIDPKTETYVGVEARPAGLNVGGASFGLVSALGGSPNTAFRASQTMGAVDTGLPTFADDWTSAGQTNNRSSNQRLYDRIGAGSKFLAAIAPAGSHLQMAGAFGEFVGQHGHEAERVLGPRARTTMYRYRGTEKTPDKELTGPYNRARTGGYDLDSLSPQNKARIVAAQNEALGRYERQKGSRPTKAEAEGIRQRATRRAFNLSEAQAAEGTVAGQVRAEQHALKWMQEKVPGKELYDLQLKSGHTPPSEGIIIDASGKIVTQAIGYGDDHYLPFNLKNLKGLKGGEYIRTRNVGGPTTEDIYTGLISGAKKITVVSRSGVFTIAFDDTFRGSRRYNDKAARMVDRYGKILDAIKSEQVERRALPDDIRAEIAAQVESEQGYLEAPEKRRVIQQKEAEYKEHPRPSQAEEAEIEAQVAHHGGTEQEQQRLRLVLRNQVIEQKAFNYRLNGDGYAAAIKALEEQFPYYIHSDHIPTQAGRYEGAPDKGYVKPRHNRPHAALEGYYDTSIAGEGTVPFPNGEKSGKFHADQVDYQNFRGRLKPIEQPATAEGEAPAAPAAAAAPGAKATPGELAADQLARQADVQTLADKATVLNRYLDGKIEVNAQGNRGDLTEPLALDDAAFRTWYANPANQTKFHTAITRDIVPRASEIGLGKGDRNDPLLAYMAARGQLGGEKFNRAKHLGTVPDQPFSFDGPEYLRGGVLKRKEDALKRISQQTRVPDFGPLEGMNSDTDFQEALRAAHRLRDVSGQLASAQSPQERQELLRGIETLTPAVRDLDDRAKALLMQPEKVDDLVENVNRAWALKSLINRQKVSESVAAARPEPEPEPVTTAAPPTVPRGTLRAVEPPEPTPEEVLERLTPEEVLDRGSRHATMLHGIAESYRKTAMDDVADEIDEVADAYRNAEEPGDLIHASRDSSALMQRNPELIGLIGRGLHRIARDIEDETDQ